MPCNIANDQNRFHSNIKSTTQTKRLFLKQTKLSGCHYGRSSSRSNTHIHTSREREDIGLFIRWCFFFSLFLYTRPPSFVCRFPNIYFEIENSNDISTRTKYYHLSEHSVMHIITNHIYVFIVERQKESSMLQTNARKVEEEGWAEGLPRNYKI